MKISKTKYIDPQVNLIKSLDCKTDAWLFSRPNVDPKTFDVTKLENSDLPVNGFAQYVYQIKGSLLIRDLIFTLRPIQPWARSNRPIPLTPQTIGISSEYKDKNDEEMQRMYQKVYDQLKEGIPQDYVKDQLPMATSTDFTISIDDRTLVAFLKMMKIHNPDLYKVYGLKFLKAIKRDESYIDKRPVNDIFDRVALIGTEFDLVEKTPTVLGEYFIGGYHIASNLMSQFIRQHYSLVKNGLYNLIDGKSIEDIRYLKCDQQVDVVLYATKSAIDKVTSVRSCWFAQWDKETLSSWSHIIGAYTASMSPEDFKNVLPCKGMGRCECRVYEDMKPRINAGKFIIKKDGTKQALGDVNPPCPYLIEDPSIVQYRKMKYKSDSLVMKAWENLVANNLIPNNPQNEDLIEYKHNIEKYGYCEDNFRS